MIQKSCFWIYLKFLFFFKKWNIPGAYLFITEGEIHFLSYNLLHKTPWHYTILPLERYQPSLAHLFMFKWDTALLSVLKFRNKIRIIQAQKRIDVVFCILSLSLSLVHPVHTKLCVRVLTTACTPTFSSVIYTLQARQMRNTADTRTQVSCLALSTLLTRIVSEICY